MFSKAIWIFVVVALFKLTTASVMDTIKEDATTPLPQTLLSQDLPSQSSPELTPSSNLSYVPTSTSEKLFLSNKPSSRRRKKIKVSKKSRPAAHATFPVVRYDSNVDASIPVKFQKQHPLKPITDLITYGMRKDLIQPRTGLLLFGAITAIEVVIGTTLLVGLSGAAIAALAAMVKFLLATTVIMLG